MSNLSTALTPLTETVMDGLRRLSKQDLNFSDIERAVRLDHLRPYYKLASHNVHANPKGMLFRLGLYPESDESSTRRTKRCWFSGS